MPSAVLIQCSFDVSRNTGPFPCCACSLSDSVPCRRSALQHPESSNLDAWSTMTGQLPAVRSQSASMPGRDATARARSSSCHSQISSSPTAASHSTGAEDATLSIPALQYQQPLDGTPAEEQLRWRSKSAGTLGGALSKASVTTVSVVAPCRAASQQ